MTIDKFDVLLNPDADHQHSREQFGQMFKNHAFPNGRRQAPEKDPETMNREGRQETDEAQNDDDGVNYFA